MRRPNKPKLIVPKRAHSERYSSRSKCACSVRAMCPGAACDWDSGAAKERGSARARLVEWSARMSKIYGDSERRRESAAAAERIAPDRLANHAEIQNDLAPRRTCAPQPPAVSWPAPPPLSLQRIVSRAPAPRGEGAIYTRRVGIGVRGAAPRSSKKGLAFESCCSR